MLSRMHRCHNYTSKKYGRTSRAENLLMTPTIDPNRCFFVSNKLETHLKHEKTHINNLLTLLQLRKCYMYVMK